MKNKKIFLDLEEETPLKIGLIRLLKKVASNEVFFKINQQNEDPFYRVEDLKIDHFSFSKFECYHSETKTFYYALANRSAPFQQKTTDELFAQTEEINFLLPKNQDIDYILYAKDSIPDFSLFLLPETLIAPIQELIIHPQHELYTLIQYYE